MICEWCSIIPRGIRLATHILPNAGKTEVVGVFDGALKIRLHAQPIEGKANEVLIRYLAGALRVPKSAINITHGHAGKRKIIEINARDLDLDEVRRVLLSPDA